MPRAFQTIGAGSVDVVAAIPATGGGPPGPRPLPEPNGSSASSLAASTLAAVPTAATAAAGVVRTATSAGAVANTVTQKSAIAIGGGNGTPSANIAGRETSDGASGGDERGVCAPSSRNSISASSRGSDGVVSPLSRDGHQAGEYQCTHAPSAVGGGGGASPRQAEAQAQGASTARMVTSSSSAAPAGVGATVAHPSCGGAVTAIAVTAAGIGLGLPAGAGSMAESTMGMPTSPLLNGPIAGSAQQQQHQQLNGVETEVSFPDIKVEVTTDMLHSSNTDEPPQYANVLCCASAVAPPAAAVAIAATAGGSRSAPGRPPNHHATSGVLQAAAAAPVRAGVEEGINRPSGTGVQGDNGAGPASSPAVGATEALLSNTGEGRAFSAVGSARGETTLRHLPHQTAPSTSNAASVVRQEPPQPGVAGTHRPPDPTAAATPRPALPPFSSGVGVGAPGPQGPLPRAAAPPPPRSHLPPNTIPPTSITVGGTATSAAMTADASNLKGILRPQVRPHANPPCWRPPGPDAVHGTAPTKGVPQMSSVPRGSPHPPSAGAAAAAVAVAAVAATAGRGQLPPRGVVSPAARGAQAGTQPIHVQQQQPGYTQQHRHQQQQPPRGHTTAGRGGMVGFGRGVAVPGTPGSSGMMHPGVGTHHSAAAKVQYHSHAQERGGGAGRGPAPGATQPLGRRPYASHIGRGNGPQNTTGGVGAFGPPGVGTPGTPGATVIGGRGGALICRYGAAAAGGAHTAPVQQPPPGYVRAMSQGATGPIMETQRAAMHDQGAGRMGPGGIPMHVTGGGGGMHGGGDGDEGGPVKENTGRWTYDEHRLFLRGLEIHGKGWKKIASLIKTRTVVQIRTHAQKYFQKIAKAKQNGDHGEVAMDAKGKGSRRKSRDRRRMEDLLRGPTALAPSLQPYVAGAGAVEMGLYRFLSPITIQDIERPPTAGYGAGAGGEGGGAAGGGGGGGGVSTPLGAHAATAAAAAVISPNWYRAGRGVDDLLSEAEGLDWLADSGGAGGPAAAQAAAAAAAAAADAGIINPTVAPRTGMPCGALQGSSSFVGIAAEGSDPGKRSNTNAEMEIFPASGSCASSAPEVPSNVTSRPSLKRARSAGVPPATSPPIGAVAPACSEAAPTSGMPVSSTAAVAGGRPPLCLPVSATKNVAAALTRAESSLSTTFGHHQNNRPSATPPRERTPTNASAVADTVIHPIEISTGGGAAQSVRAPVTSVRSAPLDQQPRHYARDGRPFPTPIAGTTTTTASHHAAGGAGGLVTAMARATIATPAMVAAANGERHGYKEGAVTAVSSPSSQQIDDTLVGAAGSALSAPAAISYLAHGAGLSSEAAPAGAEVEASSDGVGGITRAAAAAIAAAAATASATSTETLGVEDMDLSADGLQGSEDEQGHLSGLSDLEGFIEDQELPVSPPFGAAAHDRNPLSTEAAGGGADTSIDLAAVTPVPDVDDDVIHSSNDNRGASIGEENDDDALDEDAFVAALLDA